MGKRGESEPTSSLKVKYDCYTRPRGKDPITINLSVKSQAEIMRERERERERERKRETCPQIPSPRHLPPCIVPDSACQERYIEATKQEVTMAEKGMDGGEAN